MSQDEIVIAANVAFVLSATALVFFMQAGFAMLETGLVRMKNAGHVAGKTLLGLGAGALTYWLVGFGLAFGDRAEGAPAWLAGITGTSGFAPGVGELLAIGEAPFAAVERLPASSMLLFQLAFAAVSLAILWGGLAERARLHTYLVLGVGFTLAYSVMSHWVWHPDGWLAGLGMQDFAGSTVVHYQGALGALAAALLLGPRVGRYAAHRIGERATAMPGHNVPLVVLGTVILWFGWFGFNAGSTLGIEGGGLGFAAYVALTTSIAAAAGVLGALATSRRMLERVDVVMLCNGALAALVAITAACAFVAPWAAALIGLVAGVIAVAGVVAVERLGIDDPVGAVAVHGVAGVWGTLALGVLAAPELVERVGVGGAGLLYGGGAAQLGVQALGLLAVGTASFAASGGLLWLLRATVGIRVDEAAEEVGLDVAEHGAYGYAELFDAVPGGWQVHMRERELHLAVEE